MITVPTTFIHLGMPKTATTSLQVNLFCNHSQIHFFGKFSGGRPVSCIDQDLQDIFCGVGQPDIGKDLQAKVEYQLAHAVQNNLVPVLSKETLAKGDARTKLQEAESLYKTFGSCQAFLCVREPISFMKSFYTQSLKSFHRGWRRPRPGWMAEMGTPPYYFDINEWMRVRWDSLDSPRQILAVADTAEIYARVFGKDKVKILIFEEFVRDPDLFIRQLCGYLKIDAEEGIRLLKDRRANEGITIGYIQQIKAVEKSFIKKTVFRNANGRIKLKMLDPKTRRGEKFRPELSDEWVEIINDFSRKQSRRLVSDWGLPLDDYGYQL